jgi:putative ABC transport system permease protein
VHSVDSEQPIEKIATIDGIVRESTAEEWFYTVTTAGFGGVAIALALAGLVGVVSRSVTERAREIVIRMALGAQPVHVVRHAVREGLYPVGIGLVVGSLGAWGASRLLRGFLFEVSPVDPLAYTSAVTLLGVAASVACYLASRRATRLEPMAVLKAE